MSTARNYLPFFISFSAGLLFFTPVIAFSVSDSQYMLSSGISLYELGSLSVAVKTDIVTGQVLPVYPKFGPGLSVFLVPFIFLNDLLSAIYSDIDKNIVISITSLLLLAGTTQAVSLIVQEMGYSRRRGLILGVSSIFGSFAYPYVNFFFTEPLQMFCLTMSVLFLFRAANRKDFGRACLLLAAAGIFLGYGVFTKVTLVLAVPVFFVYALLRVRDNGGWPRVVALLSLAAPLVLFGALIAGLNFYRFGSIFETGYADEASLFVMPFFDGLYNFLFNPNKSMILFAPFMLLVPYGAIRLFKRFPGEVSLITALFLSNLFLYSMWWGWEGSVSWGPRFLLPYVPLCAVLLAGLLDGRAFRAATAALLAAGFAVNLLGVLQDFPGYDYLVFNAAKEMKLATDRPDRDYVQIGEGRHAPAFVVSTIVPEFNAVSGHLWLLRAKYEGWANGYGLGARNPGI